MKTILWAVGDAYPRAESHAIVTHKPMDNTRRLIRLEGGYNDGLEFDMPTDWRELSLPGKPTLQADGTVIMEREIYHATEDVVDGFQIWIPTITRITVPS